MLYLFYIRRASREAGWLSSGSGERGWRIKGRKRRGRKRAQENEGRRRSKQEKEGAHDAREGARERGLMTPFGPESHWSWGLHLPSTGSLHPCASARGGTRLQTCSCPGCRRSNLGRRRREEEERGGGARRRRKARGTDLSDAIWLRSQLRPSPSQRGCGFKALKAEGRACARSSERQGCLCASFLCALSVC